MSSDRYINMALLYYYRKATEEVKHFCKKEKLMKISVEQEGVLLSKGRLLDEMNFKNTGELSNLTLGSLGVKTRLPLIERFSPLAYSIAEHIHWNIAKHRGVETCTRMSGENVSILQAPTLYKELADDCMLCIMKRGKYLKVEMGPVSDSQLTLAPPFWACQVDLFGPITVVVPGFERATRNRRVLEAKCWVMTAVCPTTRLVNLQTMESSKAAGWIDAFTRLSCEVGCPSMVFCDRDKAGVSAFDIAEVEFRDLKLALHREKGITVNLCPVGGHDRHGHVERVIRSVQESFYDCGLDKAILHATGLQTLCKLVENQYNNLPLGYHFGRDADNTALLKIITPNMLRIGRVNKRSMDGPIRIPANRQELLAKVDEIYDAWFKIWRETMVPKLMFQQKWFNSDKELKEGDLVYFRKVESKLEGKWIIGVIDTLERSRDDLIRMVWVRYQNAGETHSQLTSRTVRQMIKLWSIDDNHLSEDLAELEKRFGAAKGDQNDDKTVIEDEVEDRDDDTPEETASDNHVADDETINTGIGNDVSSSDGELSIENDINDDFMLQVETNGIEEGGALPQQQGGDVDTQSQQGGGDNPPAANTRSKKKCSTCCCVSHHNLSLHSKAINLKPLPMAVELAMNNNLATYYNELWDDGQLGLQGMSLDETIMCVGGNMML